MNKLLRIFLLAAAFVVTFASCERRPLVDPTSSVSIRVQVNIKAIANVTTEIYNERIPVPDLTTNSMRVMIYDPQTKGRLGESIISGRTVDSEGNQVLSGNLNISYGSYDLLVYNEFDTPKTKVSDTGNLESIIAYTDDISAETRMRLGLGTNLYGTKDTLFETYGMEEFSDLLSKKSSFMQELANIDIYDEDLLRAQGLAPTAAIEISEIDREEGTLSFSVSDFKNIYEKIASVEVEAWDNDHPDDVVHMKMKKEKKNYYTCDLSGFALPGETIEVKDDGETGESTEGTEDWESADDLLSEEPENASESYEDMADPDKEAEKGSDLEETKRKEIRENGAEYAEESEDAVPGGTDGSAVTKGLNFKSCNVYVYANGKSGRRYEVGCMTGDLTLRTGDIYEYLELLKQNGQYSIFVTIRDDGTREITTELQEKLAALGLEETLPGHYRWSYYGILIPGQDKIEEIGEKELSCTGTLPDGAEYSVISQGGLSGAGGGAGRYLTCSVKINNVEYAVQRIGLNFVIYDNEHSVVADSVEFNTYDGLGARRKEPSLQTAQ